MTKKRLLTIVLALFLCMPSLILAGTTINKPLTLSGITEVTEATTITTSMKPTIAAYNVSGQAGSTIDIPIRLSNNPGITSLTLDISYDRDTFTLTNVQDNGLLKGASFVKSPSINTYPYRLLWNIGTSNSTANGTLVTLSFKINENAQPGSYEIGISCQEDDIYNTALENVSFIMDNSTITVVSGTQIPNNSEKPDISDNPGTLPSGKLTITAGGITQYSGYTVGIPIRLSNNPGITSLAMDISYDRNALTLTGVSDNNLLEGASFVESPSVDSYPYRLIWNIGTSDSMANGTLATLYFRINDNAQPGNYEIGISCQEDDIYNTSLENVNFKTEKGIIIVIPDTIIDVPVNSKKPDISDNPDILPSGSLTITAGTITAEKSMEYKDYIVGIPIHLSNNPGITSLAMDISYDRNALTLTEVTNTNLLKDASFVESPSVNAYPYRLIWNIGTSDSTENGTLAILYFRINNNAQPGNYEIGISCQEDDIYNTSLKNVNFRTGNGLITVKLNTEVPESPEPDSSQEPSYIPTKGDVDNNGKINLKDAQLALRAALHLIKLDNKQATAADVNKDGGVTLKDAQLILRFALHLINNF